MPNANHVNEDKIVTTFERIDELKRWIKLQNGELNIWEYKNGLGKTLKTITNN